MKAPLAGDTQTGDANAPGPGERGLVSIIIPTYRRKDLVVRAVQSVLQQTYRPIEVIVVSDGPDAEVRAAMQAFDERVRYFELAQNAGPAAARNEGVRRSRGEWLAFSDDDDEQMPEKTMRQMSMADSAKPWRIIACRTVYRCDGQDQIWPERPLADNEDVADYILRRPSLLGRPGVLTLQSMLVHRSVLARVAFTCHADHEDWAWLLQAWHLAGARIAFVWEPLSVYNITTGGESRSRRMNWRDSWDWAMQYREWIGPRAMNSFLATKVALKARRAGDWAALRRIAGFVLRNRPSWLELGFLAGIALIPAPLLHRAWKRSLQSGETPADRKGEEVLR